jgi:hypothetical protein
VRTRLPHNTVRADGPTEVYRYCLPGLAYRSIHPAGAAVRTAPHVGTPIDTHDAFEHGVVRAFAAGAHRCGTRRHGRSGESLGSRHVRVIGVTSWGLQMAMTTRHPEP